MRGDFVMAMRCKCCTHLNRLQIDREIVSGKPMERIGREYGVSAESVRHHKAHCVSRQMLKSAEVREMVNVETLLADVKMMRERCLDILERAKKRNWMNTELRALGEIRSLYQFMAGLAIDLRAMTQAEARSADRETIERLKTSLTRDELEFLSYLLSKASIETN